MADVFIVHHRSDRPFVERLSRGLARRGLRANRRFDHTLIAKPAARAAMDKSDAIVVVWSPNAAGEDLEAYVRFSPPATPLHFVSVEGDAPYEGFERAKRHDLTGWRSELEDPDFSALAEALPRRERGKKTKAATPAPIMSVIVQNDPRNLSLAEQQAAPAAKEKRPRASEEAQAAGSGFEIVAGPSKDAAGKRLMMAAGALITAAAGLVGYVAFFRPGLAPAPAVASVAPPPSIAPLAPMEATTLAAPLEPDPSLFAGASVAPAAATTRGRLPPPEGALRGRLPEAAPVSESPLTPASELVAKPPSPSTPPLAPAHLRDRIIAAPASSIFLLAPDMRATVERARGSAARGAEMAETALVSAGPGMRTAQLSSGSLYAGQWSAGGANGVGASRSRDGTEYAGSWRNSRPHGRGVLLRPNGVRYDGEFANGAPTGRGVVYDAQGRQIAAGADVFAALD
ncbi:MAG: hypothetical protein JNJ73_20260 [Hyphomonadaceae bacterium]|nr:hypothetical protein [Hyphomonadaceae bacterium]